MAKKDRRKIDPNKLVRKDPIEKKKDNTKTTKPRIKVPTKPLVDMRIKDKQRNRDATFAKQKEAEGSISETKSQGKISKAWDIASNPFTAAELATKQGYVPDNFAKAIKAGTIDRSTLEIAGDIINPADVINSVKDVPSLIKDGKYSQAALQGLSALPLINETGKIIKNVSKTKLSKTYKLNPFAEKLNNPNSSYRVTGVDAKKDFLDSKVLRTRNPADKIENGTNGISLDRRGTTPFPSFTKGEPNLQYLPKKGGVVFKTDLPTYGRGDINPITLKEIKGRHYANRVLDPTTGKTLTDIPSEHIKVYDAKPNWLTGFKEIKKAKGGLLTTNDTTMRKKVKIKNKDTNPPKHFVGALIGAGVSVAGSLIAAKKEEKANLELAQDRQASTYASQMNADKLELEEYPEEGLGTVDYYQAKGGKLATPMSYKTRGGDLEPVSSDMEEVVGNKHNESAIDNTSGVKLNNGKSDIAEVEDEEMIKDGRMVFSAQTKVDGNKTYADVAKKLSTEKGKLEEGLMTKDKISMNTNRRKIKAIDRAENSLFIKQEAEKGNDVQSDLPKGAKGLEIPNTFANSGIGKGVNAALPFVDNVANMILTSKTPKLPKPTLVRQKNLETEVNVNPQLAAVNDAVDSSNRFVTNNSSSSAVARNAVAKTRLAGAKQTGQILAGKENQERTLRNQNVQQRQQVEAVNAQKLDTAALAETGRQDAIQQRTSANLANMAGDLIDNRNFKAAQDYNAERLDVAREIGDVNGTSLRADLNNPSEQNKLRTDKTYAQQQLERYKNSPKELAQLKAVLGIQ